MNVGWAMTRSYFADVIVLCSVKTEVVSDGYLGVYDVNSIVPAGIQSFLTLI